MIPKQTITLIILLSCLFIFPANSQYYSPKEIRFLPFEETLDYRPIANYKQNIHNRNYYIKAVIDNREDTTHIGSYYRNNKLKRHYNFKGGLHHELSSFLFKTGASFRMNNLKAVILEIEEFEYIRMNTSYLAKGSIYLKANFLSESGKLLYPYVMILENKRSLSDIRPAMNVLWQSLLNGIYITNYLSDGYMPTTDYPEITSKYSEVFNTPRKRGFYVNLDELIHNNPSLTPDFRIDKKGDPDDYHKWEIVFEDATIENNKETFINNVIGFSDGSQLYVTALNYHVKFGFNQVKELGRFLYFEGKGPGNLGNGPDGAGIDYRSSYVVSFMFGLSGALLVNALAQIPAQYEAVIDLASGKLYIIDSEFLKKIVLTAPKVKPAFEAHPNKYDDHIKQVWIKEINKYF